MFFFRKKTSNGSHQRNMKSRLHTLPLINMAVNNLAAFQKKIKNKQKKRRNFPATIKPAIILLAKLFRPFNARFIVKATGGGGRGQKIIF